MTGIERRDCDIWKESENGRYSNRSQRTEKYLDKEPELGCSKHRARKEYTVTIGRIHERSTACYHTKKFIFDELNERNLHSF